MTVPGGTPLVSASYIRETVCPDTVGGLPEIRDLLKERLMRPCPKN